ncbi:MAG: family 10 glycosylhydrolase [Bacteroidota bacterium]
MRSLVNYSICCLMFSIFWCGFSQSQKGVWLTDVASKALDSRESIKETVQQCKSIGLDNIYVVVWNRGYTLYPSEVMQKQFGVEVMPRFLKFDMLQTLIDEAHAEGLQVHAWFEFGFSSSYQEADGGHILQRKPKWNAIDHKGQLVSKNGFQWMNAFHPEVQEFLLSLIMEVVENYDIDGIQGDDRLPANPSTAGYDDYTVSEYRKEHNGQSPPDDYRDADWVDWRASRLNLFAQTIYKTVKAIDSNVKVTMAPSIYPWSKEEYLQDWPTWVKEGWVDQIIPQVYRYDMESYSSTLESNLKFVAEDKRHLFVPGILLQVDDYTPSERFLKNMIQTNRNLGLKAEVFFFYEGLKKHNTFFTETYPKM